MSDRWEDRKDETRRRVQLAVDAFLRTTPTGRPLPMKTWPSYPGETVDQPLDPHLFGLGVLYAIEADEDGRMIVIRYRDGANDTVNVEAMELIDDPRHSFNGSWYAYFDSTVRVPLPEAFTRWGGVQLAEVSHPGGGARDAHRVGIAARALAIAAFLGEHLDKQMVAVEDDVRDPWEPDAITPERFVTLAAGKWVVAEMMPKNGRKRTVRGDVVTINGFLVTHPNEGVQNIQRRQVEEAIGPAVRSMEIEDKAGRRHIVDVPLVQRLITGGEDGITLVVNGELAPDYRLARR